MEHIQSLRFNDHRRSSILFTDDGKYFINLYKENGYFIAQPERRHARNESDLFLSRIVATDLVELIEKVANIFEFDPSELYLDTIFIEERQ